MKKPIDVTLDPEWPIAYVQYTATKQDGALDLVRDPDGIVREYGYDDPEDEYLGVVVYRDRDAAIAGIEILNIDDPVELALARDFAADHDLEFPADVRAAARMLV
jgi:hypothetical protein